MITEDYVSFEVAKLLKKKGFNEPIQYFYKFDSKELYRGTVFTNTQIGDKFYNAPTHQMVMKWLREVHNIFITISPISGKGYGAILCDVGDFDDFNYIGETDYFFHPEEAVESGIKYALENLI